MSDDNVIPLDRPGRRKRILEDLTQRLGRLDDPAQRAIVEHQLERLSTLGEPIPDPYEGITEWGDEDEDVD